MIDSLNGYQAAMPEEQALVLHMHELLQYLNRQGASTFLTVAQHGLVGDMKAPVDVTYLADTVILLALFRGAGPSAPGNLGDQKENQCARRHDSRISRLIPEGITVGEPLMGFQGVLRGVPEFISGRKSLLETAANDPAPSERGLILAPQGRDAMVASAMLRGGRSLRTDDVCRTWHSWLTNCAPAQVSRLSPKRR